MSVTVAAGAASANFTVTKLTFAQLSPLAFTTLRFATSNTLLFTIMHAVKDHGPPLPHKLL